MTFAAPDLLWLLLLAPAAAAAAAWLWRRRLAADAAWASRALWKRLLPAYAPRRLTLAVATLAVAVLGASFALARPRWGAGEQKVERKGVDVVFLLDSSLSMAAPDAPPSRLFVAKSLLRRIVREMPENRVALVQTEGDSLVLAPLTLDGGVIDLLLDAVDAGSLPTPGTELAPGITTALRLFGQGSEKHRVLVILSDGEDFGGGLDGEIGRLKDEGVAVFAIGIGTPQGTTLPIPGSPGELKKDQDGNVVVSQLHEETLEKLARATGGTYLRATSAAADPAPILRQIDRLEKRTIDSQSLSTREERFQWPLALAVLALLLHLGVGPFVPDARPRTSPAPGKVPAKPAVAPIAIRGHLAPALLLLGALAFPSLPWQPHLPDWVERWLYNPRERTEKSSAAYARKKPDQAVGPADTAVRLAPDDPTVQYDAGTAHLAAGDHRKAVSLLEKAAKGAAPELAPAAHYNLGNARLAAGDAAGAVDAYKQALRATPGNAAAKFNLELALREEQKKKLGGGGKPAGSRGNQKQNQDRRARGRGRTTRSRVRTRNSRRTATSRPTRNRRASNPSRDRTGKRSRPAAQAATTACRSSATSRR